MTLKLNDANENGLYEDEDTRQFYESLPDLKSLIPGVSLYLYSIS